jgi:site-specific recombinase XerD
MHDLIPIDSIAAGALTTAEIQATMDYAEAEKAASTRIAYDSDFKDFAIWCAARGMCPLPASPATVAVYLSHLADIGRKSSTIARRCAAIAYRHRCANIDPLPTASEGVRAVLRGIRRTIGTAKVQKAAATATVVRNMLDCCGDNLIGIRDRALVTFGLASALRRSELSALVVDDLIPAKDGYRVVIRRSKTDQEGEGQEIAVPRGLKLRPVEAMERWLEAASITSGPVFRAVLVGGRVQSTALTPECLSRVVKKLAQRAGLDPRTFAGHSLRAGFVTTCVEAGAPLLKVMETTRHKSVQMLQVYSRRVDLFKDHAGASWL